MKRQLAIAGFVLVFGATGCDRLLGGTSNNLRIELRWDDLSQNLDLHALPNTDAAFGAADYSACNPNSGGRSYWLALTDGSEGEYADYGTGDAKEAVVAVHHNTPSGTPVAWSTVDLTLNGTTPLVDPDVDLESGYAWIFDVRVGYDEFEYVETQSWGLNADCEGYPAEG